MSTGKRLAKRSIIGTRVCAPGTDGKYYSGVIHSVIPSSSTQQTRYLVRFNHVPGGRPPSPSTEFHDRDLIGPGFGSVTGARLVPGQRVFLTYNGREIQAEVTQHKEHQDEVHVKINLNNGQETMNLTKRIDEVRLLESRKSARLADQDTDFARLADMAGDRKRAASHTIDMPHVPGSRKRRPSSSNDSDKSYHGGFTEINNGNNTTMMMPICTRQGCRKDEHSGCLDECSAAMVLMSLSGSPPNAFNPLKHFQPNYGGQSNSGGSSSGASWRSGTPSPGLSEEGAPSCSWQPGNNGNAGNNTTNITITHHSPPYMGSGSPYGSTPESTGTLDEGIWSDYYAAEDAAPKKKKTKTRTMRTFVEHGYNFEERHLEAYHSPKVLYQCTWKGCLEVRRTCAEIEEHVRRVHLGPKKICNDGDWDSEMSAVHEEEFYYQEIAEDFMSSPPTMSHRDMARPPHEDPEYQKMLRLGATTLVGDTIEAAVINHTGATIVAVNGQKTFNFSSNQPLSPGAAPIRQIKFSARPQYHNGLLKVSPYRRNSTSPRRRSSTKKCRGRFGVHNRDSWCKQCQWKKACTYSFAEIRNNYPEK